MRHLSGVSRLVAAVVATLCLVLGVSISASATPARIADLTTVTDACYTVISPDGSRLYVMSQTSKQLQVIDTSTNTAIGTYDLSSGITTDQVVYLTISPNGTKIYASGYGGSTADSEVFVIDVSGITPTVTASIPLFNTHRSSSMMTIGGSAITPNGSLLYVTAPMDKTVQVIDTATNQVTNFFTVTSTTNSSYNLSYPLRVTVSPNGQYYFVTFSAAVPSATQGIGYAGVVSMRVSDDTVRDQIEFGLRDISQSSVPTAQPWGVAVSSDSHTLFVSSSMTGGAWIKQIEVNNDGTFNRSLINTATVTGMQPGEIRLSADNTLLYVGTFSSTGLRIFRTSNLSTAATLNMTNINLNSMIAPSPDVSKHTAYVGSFSTVVYFIGEYIGPQTQVINKTTGENFSSTAMTATGLTGGTVTYSISPGLPSGLSFNTSTGVISGAATSTLTTTTFTITGTDGTASATSTVTLTITAGSGGSGGSGSNSSQNSSGSSASLAKTGNNPLPLIGMAGLFLTAGVLLSAIRLQHKAKR